MVRNWEMCKFQQVQLDMSKKWKWVSETDNMNSKISKTFSYLWMAISIITRYLEALGQIWFGALPSLPIQSKTGKFTSRVSAADAAQMKNYIFLLKTWNPLDFVHFVIWLLRHMRPSSGNAALNATLSSLYYHVLFVAFNELHTGRPTTYCMWPILHRSHSAQK